MRWQEGGDDRKDIEDRRDQGGGGMGGGGGFPLGALLNMRGLGLGGTLIVVVLGLVFGRGLLGGGGGSSSQGQAPVSSGPGATHSAEEEKLVDFCGFVFNNVQDSWAAQFAALGKHYTPAKLVLYTQATQSGCGNADAAIGPFYCPVDQKVYLDLTFYQELRTRFGAPGDFAQAYVIAHELGHHVQNLLGIEEKMRREQNLHSGETNELSVRLELQADCFAGIWAKSTDQKKLLDPGDVDEALGAAAAVGDDRLQKQAGGRVNPESWTHGSSEERMRWFRTGYAAGKIEACDTFAVAKP